MTSYASENTGILVEDEHQFSYNAKKSSITADSPVKKSDEKQLLPKKVINR
jgi:hypothetical protein